MFLLKKSPKRMIALVLVFLFALPNSAYAAHEKITKDSILEELSDVIDYLSENYVGGDITLDEIREGILQGLTDQYDDYTQFMTDDEYSSFIGDINGSFVGIGVTLSNETEIKGVKIANVIPTSPAEEAGLKAGDIIIHINDADFTDRPFSDFVNSLRGEANTKVLVTVQRGDKELTFNITRRVVNVSTVTVKKPSELDLGTDKEANELIRYVSISTFGDTTSKEFKAVVDKLKKEGVKTIIIDLRDNTGGYISVCADIARLIMPKGTIFSQKSADTLTRSTYSSVLEKPPFKIVVLVNGNTVSAAEILASALQDSGSILLGQQTYGKGVGQQTVDLPLGGSLKATTIEWFTRNGNTIQGKGITPDIIIEEELEVDNILSEGYDEALKLTGIPFKDKK